MDKDPAFLMYSSDWISGTSEFSLEEKGAYIDLLCHQHRNESIPKNIEKLAQICRTHTNVMENIWKSLSSKFVEISVDRLVNPKLNRVVDQRKDRAKKNRILGAYAMILRESEQPKAIKQKVKNLFKLEDFIYIDEKEVTDRLTDWYNRTVDQTVGPNGNRGLEDVNGDGNTNALFAEDIYQLYPRKKAKGAALKSIEKAFEKIDPEKLKEKVIEYAKSCAGKEPQYIPYPATWFNREQWGDEPEQPIDDWERDFIKQNKRKPFDYERQAIGKYDHL